ncbi:MAG: acetyl-CoA carboxylase carboxyltransferase subunit alpha [Acetobacter sp.]|nr:acetyl-CoA carboxylase carboxyltransferase subunit alpha [Acetobacter sp.]
MHQFLEFEKSIAELENKIDELRQVADPERVDIEEEIARLSEKTEKSLQTIYANLTPSQKVQVVRHAQRPHTQEYIEALITDYMPLAGDRLFAEDKAIVGGIGRFEGTPVMVIGTERGFDLETRIEHNFGMARPEGYRKAQRLMLLAGRFGLPILTFIDTAGAWPGIDAEQRGQAEAIARTIGVCFDVPVPLIAVVIGEGGSGGAVALGAGDRILMLEYAIYSVISPEACASILWRDPKQSAKAAEALKLTAQDLKRLGLIDRIIPEPVGGAHRHPDAVKKMVRDALAETLQELLPLDPTQLKQLRREKFLAMGRNIVQ